MSLSLIGSAAVLKEADGAMRHFRQVADSELYVLVRRTSPNGEQVTLRYEGRQLREVAVADETVLRLDWSDNRIAAVRDVHDREVTYSYDRFGQLVVATDVGGQSWAYAYDSEGRLVAATHPDGQPYLHVEYDHAGKVSRSSAARDFTYRYHDDSTTVIEAARDRHAFKRNAAGITVGYGNGRDFVWELVLDRDNRPSELYRNGDAYRFGYSGSSVAAIEHPEGLLRLHHDDEGRFTHASGVPIHGQQPTRVSYDADNEVTAASAENRLRYTYDDFRRLDSIEENGVVYRIAYDDAGFVSALSQGDAEVSFTRNGMGRIIGIRYPDGTESTHRYDDLGNRDRVDYSSGAGMSIRHDGRGNIVHVADRSANGTVMAQSYTIDRLNRVTQVDFAGLSTLKVSYDGTGRSEKFDLDDTIVDIEYLAHGEPIRLRAGQMQKTLLAQEPESLFLTPRGTPRAFLHNDLRPSGQPSYGSVAMSSDRLDVQIVPIEFVEVPGYLEAVSVLQIVKAWLHDTERRRIEKPSNPVFQPPEYESTNCCMGCSSSSSCGQYCTLVFGTGVDLCLCQNFNAGGGSGSSGGNGGNDEEDIEAEIDAIIKEYKDANLKPPARSEFITEHNSDNFVTSEYNGYDARVAAKNGEKGHNHSVFVLGRMEEMAEGIRKLYNKEMDDDPNTDYGLKLSSGYRCPGKNTAVGSPHHDSRHQWGNAVDLVPVEKTLPPGVTKDDAFQKLMDASLNFVRKNPGYQIGDERYTDAPHIHIEYH